MSQVYFGVREEDDVDVIEWEQQMASDAAGVATTHNGGVVGANVINDIASYFHSDAIVDKIRGVATHFEGETLDMVRRAAAESIDMPDSFDDVRRRAVTGPWRPFNWIFALLLLVFSVLFLVVACRRYRAYVKRWRVAMFQESVGAAATTSSSKVKKKE